MVQEGETRINASLASQSRGPKRWSTVQGNVPGCSVGTNEHCRDIRQWGVLNYLRGKATVTALNALQLTL